MWATTPVYDYDDGDDCDVDGHCCSTNSSYRALVNACDGDVASSIHCRDACGEYALRDCGADSSWTRGAHAAVCASSGCVCGRGFVIETPAAGDACCFGWRSWTTGNRGANDGASGSTVTRTCLSMKWARGERAVHRRTGPLRVVFVRARCRR